MKPEQSDCEREKAALRLIAQRAQAAGPEDAQDALTWIYRAAIEALVSRP